MTTGLERDERKFARVERMRARAQRIFNRLQDADDDTIVTTWGPFNRRQKRARRIWAQANRIMELQNKRFSELRVQGKWPRP